MQATSLRQSAVSAHLCVAERCGTRCGGHGISSGLSNDPKQQARTLLDAPVLCGTLHGLLMTLHPGSATHGDLRRPSPAQSSKDNHQFHAVRSSKTRSATQVSTAPKNATHQLRPRRSGCNGREGSEPAERRVISQWSRSVTCLQCSSCMMPGHML